MKLSLRAFIPLFLFLGTMLYFAIGLTRDPSTIPTQMVDRPLPAFTLTALYDESAFITHEDLIGEVSLLNIFGSWCAACVQEHPTLIALSKTKQLPIIGVDWRDKRANAKAWLARYENPYDQIIFDSESTLAIDLGVTGAPESFIIDKAGQIRYKHTGVITPQIWQETLEPIVQNLQSQNYQAKSSEALR